MEGFVIDVDTSFLCFFRLIGDAFFFEIQGKSTQKTRFTSLWQQSPVNLKGTGKDFCNVG